MSGEESKIIGELGEELANDFMSRLRWTQLGDFGTNIKCEDPKHLSASGNADRSTHGLDAVYSYDDPYTSTSQIVIVEAKAITWKKSKDSPDNKTASAIASKLNEYCEELFKKITCARRSQDFRKKFGIDNKPFQIHGLLVYHVHAGFQPGDLDAVKKKLVLPEDDIEARIHILSNIELDRIYSTVRDLEELRGNAGGDSSLPPVFHYPDFERRTSTAPWQEIISLELMFSSFLVGRIKLESSKKDRIYYFGTYSNEAIRRFCAAMSRFQIYSLLPLELAPISSDSPVEDRAGLHQYFQNTKLIVDGKAHRIPTVKTDIRPLKLSLAKKAEA